MRVPTNKKIGAFAAELLNRCTSSQSNRKQRGTYFKNMFLTGSDDGNPATFNNTFAFIDNLSSYLYSPVDLRFTIDQYGSSTAVEQAMRKAAGAEFHKYLRRSGLDTIMESAVTWGLVKGKSFIKLLWTVDGFEPRVIQPEAIGVLEENKNTLEEQEAFSHSTYITLDRLWQILRNHPNQMELYNKAKGYCIKSSSNELPDSDSTLREIAMGGIQPYQPQGNANAQARGTVEWLNTPSPQFAPEVMAGLVPFHELWVWDDERGEYGEYTTIQFIAEDVVITGELTHRNIFAEQYDPKNTAKKTHPSEHNPLSGKTPFKEICPNELDGYFWGRSEINNVALLQKGINKRVDGINKLLRRQEDPPKFISGAQGIKSQAYSLARRPGGYLTDSNPNAKMTDMYPELPKGLWDDLHEMERMFEKMAGFTPTMSGRGEAGVRAQSHAEALVKTASPRFKDRALLVERQIESIGSLALDMLRAHVPYPITAWVPKKDAGIEGNMVPANPLETPPVKNQVPIEFLFYDLPENCKVLVDSHSSSPAFSGESHAMLFNLQKVGAIDAETLLEHLGLPGMDAAIEKIEQKKQEQIEMVQQHPELLDKMTGGAKKKK